MNFKRRTTSKSTVGNGLHFSLSAHNLIRCHNHTDSCRRHYINPATIISMQNNDHHTTIYCVDTVIDSSMSISEIAALLPKSFYKIRRGSIINTIFITAIRRCEVELVFNKTFTIPAPKYMAEKKELEELMKSN